MPENGGQTTRSQYQTAEAKAAARRERVRLNVQAYRARKRAANLVDEYNAKNHSPLQTPENVRDGFFQPNQTLVLASQPHTTHPANLADIEPFSKKPPIDLSFGLLSAILNDLEKVSGRYPWRKVVQYYNPPDRILELAVLAAGARLSSFVYSDNSIYEMSIVAYQQTIQRLKPRLEDPPVDELPLMTAVINCLMHFEGTDGASRTLKSPWGTHALASYNLMKLAGPQAFRSSGGQALLRGQRGHMYVVSLRSQQACFLESKEWQTIPFQGTKLTFEDHLWNTMLANAGLTPLILSMASMLRNGDEGYHDILVSIRDKITRSRHQFQAWIDSYEAMLGQVQLHDVATWFKDSLPTVFPQSLHFQNIKDAELRLLFWTGMLGLDMATVGAMRQLLTAEKYAAAESLMPLLSQDGSELAHNICRAMEYCIGPNPKIFQGILIAAQGPLQAAYRFYCTDPARYSAECDWCLAVADMISDRGLFIRGFLQGR